MKERAKDEVEALSLLRQVARLSRLKLTEEEERRYSKEFQAILDYIAVLKSLPVEEVEPSSHPFLSRLPLRSDDPSPFPYPEEILSLAPARKGQFFTVPRFLAEEPER
jgi:aspartyl-tRNA(Asn)/glutamyl-tRNA(Gln) amidotransferase subunit C